MVRNLLGVLLIFFGVLFLLFGFYTSFELYTKDKLDRSFKDISSFLVGISQGDTLLESRDSVIVFRTPDGKLYTTQNVNLPIDLSAYYSFNEKHPSGYDITVYVRAVSIYEYLGYVLNNPVVLGVSFGGLMLILMGIYTGFTKPSTSETEKRAKELEKYDDEFLNQLRALRITLATSKMIPQESIQLAKELIDAILKKIEVKLGGKI